MLDAQDIKQVQIEQQHVSVVERPFQISCGNGEPLPPGPRVIANCTLYSVDGDEEEVATIGTVKKKLCSRVIQGRPSMKPGILFIENSKPYLALVGGSSSHLGLALPCRPCP
jgi:hypothetical protein